LLCVSTCCFINTREASSITFSGEYAKLVPGHSGALDFAGSRGVSYLDDFEGTRSVIDLKSAIGWQIQFDLLNHLPATHFPMISFHLLGCLPRYFPD